MSRQIIADSVQSNNYCVLVRMTWGASNVATYTSWTSDVVYYGETYLSEPSIAVTSNAQTANLKDVPMLVTCLPRTPLDKMTRIFPHATVTCEIWEGNPTTESVIDFSPLWAGRVTKVTKNASGFKGLVRAEISGWRSLIQYPLGIQARSTCVWSLGDSNCCVNRAARDATVTILSVVGNEVTVSGVPSLPAGQTNSYYGQGFMRIDKLSISIREYQGSGVFAMTQLVPPEWASQDALLGPGCDKSAYTCKHRFNNLQRFGGFGIRMPARNPLYEVSE